MRPLQIPPQLRDAAGEDDDAERAEWLSRLPEAVAELASRWRLTLDAPYVPGGSCAWVAPAVDSAGELLVLKVGWRHLEAEHEADALRVFDGDGAVRCLAATHLGEHTTALLIERCIPGTQLKRLTPEPEQDTVVAGLLRRLWRHEPPPGHRFSTLVQMCDHWAGALELRLDTDARGLDSGLAREGVAALRDLPRSSDDAVLLCTDLHADNILASEREPWLAVDPKPFVGDPAYDAVQHLLNCDQRLARDPVALAVRMAALLELPPDRVRLWLFARCAQESVDNPALRDPARALAP